MGFFEKMTTAGKDVAKKAKDVSDISRYMAEIEACEKRIKVCYVDLGMRYFESHPDEINEKDAEIIHSIEAEKEQIAQIREKIRILKEIEQCAACGAELQKGAKFCTVCGAKVESAEKANICPNCGRELKGDEIFCVNCGTKLEAQNISKGEQDVL